jgi:hypothetical protein
MVGCLDLPQHIPTVQAKSMVPWSKTMVEEYRVPSKSCREGAMSPKELKKFKEAIAKIDREYNTPEKARELLIKSGYLTVDGQLAERYR